MDETNLAIKQRLPEFMRRNLYGRDRVVTEGIRIGEHNR